MSKPIDWTPERLITVRQSAQQRKLTWLVGAFLQSQQPELFDTLLQSALTQPNTALASLLYGATYLKHRRKKIVANLDQQLHGIDNSEAVAALDKVRGKST